MAKNWGWVGYECSFVKEVVQTLDRLFKIVVLEMLTEKSEPEIEMFASFAMIDAGIDYRMVAVVVACLKSL
ncbi:unnamed protein product [Caretta caretta]